MAGTRLIQMVNKFVDSVDGENIASAIYITAAAFDVSPQNVAESVFPYVSDKMQSCLLAMKTLVVGAQFIYRLRVAKAREARRISRYVRAT